MLVVVCNRDRSEAVSDTKRLMLCHAHRERSQDFPNVLASFSQSDE